MNPKDFLSDFHQEKLKTLTEVKVQNNFHHSLQEIEVGGFFVYPTTGKLYRKCAEDLGMDIAQCVDMSSKSDGICNLALNVTVIPVKSIKINAEI